MARAGRALRLPAFALGVLLMSSTPAAAQTFNFTGAEQTYTVPAGITQLDVSMSGGDGGSVPSHTGGHAGTASAVLTVSAGEILYVEVGGAGATFAENAAPGGWNGGGAGASTPISSDLFGEGAGGGGASDVRTLSCGTPCTSGAASLNSRLLVAGGGGGGSYDISSTAQASNGSDADPGNNPTLGTTQTGGNAGATIPGGGGIGCSGVVNGLSGALGVGGAGGEAQVLMLEALGAGGGGGGYWGGGGGGACINTNTGAGGGGSNFAAPQASNAVMGVDTTNGANGSVSITPAAPIMQTGPGIAGTPTVGQTLSVVHGQYSNAPSSYAYQWYRCDGNGNGCNPIPGAVSAIWALTGSDLGASLRVQETASNGFQTAAPALSGATPAIGQSATGQSGAGQSVTGQSGTGATQPPTAARLTLGSVSVAGTSATLNLSCAGTTGACQGSVALKATNPVHGTSKPKKGKIVDAAKPTPETVTVGGTTFNLSSGQTTTLIVRLNLTGRRLLSKYYRLPADLAISGTTGLSQQVTFAYPRVRSAVTWTWSYKGVRTQVEQLIVKHIPKGGHVILLCHGGGCRSSHNSFTPQHGDAVALASAVSKSGTLTAGAKLRITISAPNSVAKVLDITTRANNYPKVVEACQPPGASHPSACA